MSLILFFYSVIGTSSLGFLFPGRVRARPIWMDARIAHPSSIFSVFGRLIKSGSLGRPGCLDEHHQWCQVMSISQIVQSMSIQSRLSPQMEYFMIIHTALFHIAYSASELRKASSPSTLDDVRLIDSTVIFRWN